jgi:hypothetical protein
MYQIEIGSSKGPEHHKCKGSLEGDWIVFKCPICQDYERRINRTTGEMKVFNQRSFINHSGMHFPNIQEEVLNNMDLLANDAINTKKN